MDVVFKGSEFIRYGRITGVTSEDVGEGEDPGITLTFEGYEIPMTPVDPDNPDADFYQWFESIAGLDAVSKLIYECRYGDPDAVWDLAIQALDAKDPRLMDIAVAGSLLCENWDPCKLIHKHHIDASHYRYHFVGAYWTYPGWNLLRAMYAARQEDIATSTDPDFVKRAAALITEEKE